MTNENTVWLGPAPALESCAQVGEADYLRDARMECLACIAAIRKVCAREPEDVGFTSGVLFVLNESDDEINDFFAEAREQAATGQIRVRMPRQLTKRWHQQAEGESRGR